MRSHARPSRSVAAAVALATVVVGLGVALAARPQPPVKLFPSSLGEADTVKITLLTVPAAPRVLVFWGKRRLGVIAPKQPLILQRPRDSGPMDLILQSEGYVPVQTRAYTFADNKLSVKLTPLAQKNTLLGYRQELPPDATPDGGAPSAPEAGAWGAPDAGGQ